MSTAVIASRRGSRCQPVWLPWLVCFSAALFFSYELIQMHMFSAINTDVMRVFRLDATQLGHLSAIYLWANVIFLFPAGLIVDRFSVKKIILVAMSICVLGTFLFATVEHYWAAYFSRFVTGVGSAFCLLSSVRLATRWFPEHRMALVTGFIITIAMLGGVFAQTPMTKLTEALGWRHALMVDGVIGIAIMALIAAVVKDYPNDKHESLAEEQESLKSLGFWQSLRQAYGHRQNWLAAIYTSTMNMPIIVLGAIWGTLYLTQAHHLSPAKAASVNTMIFIGTIIGGPLVGWLSDRSLTRKIPMIVGSILSMATLLVLLNLQAPSVNTLVVLFFCLGLFSSTQVISYPLVSESNASIITATALSAISITTQGGAAIYQPYFGSLLQNNWDGSFVDGVPWYNAANFNDALVFILAGFGVALIASLLLKETSCQRQVN